MRADTSQGITMEILKKLPLERQLSEILGIGKSSKKEKNKTTETRKKIIKKKERLTLDKLAQIIHFGRLRELATNSRSELDLLPLIEKLAVMVNGRWVARRYLSSLFFENFYVFIYI